MEIRSTPFLEEIRNGVFFFGYRQSVLVTLSYRICYLWLLSKGLTPGKWLLGERVIAKSHGGYPGFWMMILREFIGKFLSGLFLGLGYLCTFSHLSEKAE